MAVLAPEMAAKLRDAVLEEEAEACLQTGEDLEDCVFLGESLPVLEDALDVRSCRFEKCDLRAADGCRISFVDCVLDHCDLSGVVLEKCTLQRVRLVGCRLTGARFSEGTLMNVAFEDCQMDYCAVDKEKVQHVEIKRCTVKESMWIECRWSDLVLRDCTLDGSEFARTSMKGLDLSGCRFSHLRVDVQALRGVRVNREQAMTLSLLLGLVITD